MSVYNIFINLFSTRKVCLLDQYLSWKGGSDNFKAWMKLGKEKS